MRWRIVFFLTVVLLVLIAVVLLGPRVVSDTTVTFEPSVIGDDPQAYIEASEAAIEGVREGAVKEIIWADAAGRARTPVAIVYVHGFSATKQELRPLPDRLAENLGANLFFTRLTGHGQDGEALASATMNDWINDYAEAVAIGRAIGERVIVMATSTGASLASWAATQEDLSRDLDAMVLISPNYGVQAPGSWLLTLPWGGPIADLVAGREHSFTALNSSHEAFWTTRYPTRALLSMAATAELANRSRVEEARVPALFVFSASDAVVRPERTRSMAGRWGAGAETIMVEDSGDPGHHVIAGDVVSPANTELLALRIEEWIRRYSR